MSSERLGTWPCPTAVRHVFARDAVGLTVLWRPNTFGVPAMFNRFLVLAFSFCFPLLASAQRPEFAASTSDKPVKVFILAGQSNMQGKGSQHP